MIDTKDKTGFFVSNSGWIQPLIAALIFLVAPNMAQTFGGISGDFLTPLCLVAALVALVFAGVKARLTDTLAAKLVSHLAVMACLFLLAVQFFKLV